MNYYKMTNVDHSIEDVFNTKNLPVLMNYKQYSDRAHNSLERCQQCSMKYDLYLLVRTGFGKFVCKYCLRGAA